MSPRRHVFPEAKRLFFPVGCGSVGEVKFSFPAVLSGGNADDFLERFRVKGSAGISVQDGDLADGKFGIGQHPARIFQPGINDKVNGALPREPVENLAQSHGRDPEGAFQALQRRIILRKPAHRFDQLFVVPRAVPVFPPFAGDKREKPEQKNGSSPKFTRHINKDLTSMQRNRRKRLPSFPKRKKTSSRAYCTVIPGTTLQAWKGWS